MLPAADDASLDSDEVYIARVSQRVAFNADNENKERVHWNFLERPYMITHLEAEMEYSPSTSTTPAAIAVQQPGC